MRTRLSWIVIITAAITFILIIYVAIVLVNIDPDQIKSKKQTNDNPQTIVRISDKEKEQIDNWIVKNKLNPFGDPYDTVYTGGTPLFNETTGEKSDRYEYIVSQHPDKPWR